MLWGLGKDKVGGRVTTDLTLYGTWLESRLWGFQHGAGLGKVVQLGAGASFSGGVSPGFSAPGFSGSTRSLRLHSTHVPGDRGSS